MGSNLARIQYCHSLYSPCVPVVWPCYDTVTWWDKYNVVILARTYLAGQHDDADDDDDDDDDDDNDDDEEEEEDDEEEDSAAFVVVTMIVGEIWLYGSASAFTAITLTTTPCINTSLSHQ